MCSLALEGTQGKTAVPTMNEYEAQEYIVQNVTVTPQQVTIAYAFLRDKATGTQATSELLDLLCSHMNAKMPPQVVLHKIVDPLETLKGAVHFLTWQMAGCEAIWRLIHSNVLVPVSTHLWTPKVNLDHTTVIPGSGGSSGGFSFEDLTLPLPARVKRTFSSIAVEGQLLVNHDLYLHEIDIVHMHYEVELALRESVKCFAQELYTASLAMLGKASEGAWLELGGTLIAAVPEEMQSRVKKQKESLENPNVAIGKKIQDVLAIYEHQDIFGSIAKQSRVSLQELRSIALWSDVVRDSRNTIHFGVQPAIQNTYEKIAALLLGAVPNFRQIYHLRAIVEQNGN
jgi:hypothetical protein